MELPAWGPIEFGWDWSMRGKKSVLIGLFLSSHFSPRLFFLILTLATTLHESFPTPGYALKLSISLNKFQTDKKKQLTTSYVCLRCIYLSCNVLRESRHRARKKEKHPSIHWAIWHHDAENASFIAVSGCEGEQETWAARKGGKLMSLKWKWINMVARGCEKVE